MYNKLQMHTLQMFQLCKPIYLELMFAHYVNLKLCWQTFISPTLITSLNHQKILQRYRVQSHKFCYDPIILFMKTSLIFNMLHDLHKSFPFLMIFHCISKPQWQWHEIKFWEGNKCKWWYKLIFWYLHFLTVLKQACMCVELNLWCLCYSAPSQHNICKKWQFKS